MIVNNSMKKGIIKPVYKGHFTKGLNVDSFTNSHTMEWDFGRDAKFRSKKRS